MPKKNKGAIKAGQRGRAEENNDKAIEGLLAASVAAKKDAEKKGETFIPDPLLAVVRITAWPSTEWFTVVPPNGQAIQVRGLDKGITHMVSQICKQCKQTQAGSDTWPMVVVSLPERSAASQTGEILAFLDADEVSQFAELGFKVAGGKAEDDMFDRSDAAGGGCEEEIDISTI
jgi:hypothetical protein